MLSVRGSDHLRAAVLALKLADRELRNDINRSTREMLSGTWQTLLTHHAWTRLDQAVIVKGARILPGNPPTLVAATSKRRLSGGLIPATQFYAVEFGADHNTLTTYDRRSANGGTHKVTRRTSKQLPQRRRTGRVAYAAAKEFVPRAAALWVQLIVKKYNDAAEKGE